MTTSSCGTLCQCTVFICRFRRKDHFWSIDHCSLCWLWCWARCWMLQDMDNMEASCIFYVKVCMFDELEQSKVCVLTVSDIVIVILTVQHGMIFSLCFMWDPWDSLRHTSPDVLSVEGLPLNYWQSRDFGCWHRVFVIVSKQTTSYWLAANHGVVRNPCNLQPYAAGFIMSRMCKVAVTYCILTWS